MTHAYTNGVHRGTRPVIRTKILDITDMPLAGVVKWYDDARSFGFIEPDDGGRDVFLHKSVVGLYGLRPLDLLKGVRVSFALGEQKPGRGPEAAAIAIR